MAQRDVVTGPGRGSPAGPRRGGTKRGRAQMAGAGLKERGKYFFPSLPQS